MSVKKRSSSNPPTRSTTVTTTPTAAATAPTTPTLAPAEMATPTMNPPTMNPTSTVPIRTVPPVPSITIKTTIVPITRVTTDPTTATTTTTVVPLPLGCEGRRFTIRMTCKRVVHTEFRPFYRQDGPAYMDAADFDPDTQTSSAPGRRSSTPTEPGVRARGGTTDQLFFKEDTDVQVRDLPLAVTISAPTVCELVFTDEVHCVIGMTVVKNFDGTIEGLYLAPRGNTST